MGSALALALAAVAALASLASADVLVDVRAEGRTTTLASPGVRPSTRQALIARPGAALRVDAVPLRVTGAYAARVWTSDVEARSTPFVTQDAQLRLETYHASPWRARATASAARGWTDPLSDPVQALQQSGPAQSPALAPVEFDAVRATVDASFPLDPRTTLAGEATRSRSGSAHLADRSALPLQDGASARLVASWLVSERSTLRLAASASGTRTAQPSGSDDSGFATASATWRARLTPTLEGWAGAGALVSGRDAPNAPAYADAAPVWDVGVAYARGTGEADLAARAIPFTDRFTGNVGVMIQAAGALRWRASPRLSFETAASGGALPSAQTALASLDARARYALRERLGLAVALVGRWQHEERTGIPSFTEIGLVAAISWDSGRVAPGPPAAGGG